MDSCAITEVSGRSGRGEVTNTNRAATIASTIIAANITPTITPPTGAPLAVGGSMGWEARLNGGGQNQTTGVPQFRCRQALCFGMIQC